MMFTLTRRKCESQGVNLRLKLLFLVFSLQFLVTSPSEAVVDPLASPNNKFGIHIIAPTHNEASPAAQLANSSGGDWGYVTVLVESGSRDHNKWQSFFDDLRRRHLIPLVRLATQPSGGNWKLPYEGEEQAWADFLGNLNWPTKNRYVIIYNEPNQGQEWNGKVDPRSYAQVLDKTIKVLKEKSPDFFVLNAGFDASAPEKPPLYLDEWNFLKQMNDEVPGIFNKLDGWVSHSYPNPGFAGSPEDSGRGTIRTFQWELDKLKELGVTRALPIFIAETGWKHAEGLDFDKSLPTAETVGKYLRSAFEQVWDDAKIVAITPFLLNYQESPFDHFSFKKITGEIQNLKVLGLSSSGQSQTQTYPDFYPHYEAMLGMPKNAGRPVQENKGTIVKGEIYKSIVAGETYTIPITFKNTGQSIWNEYETVELRALLGDVRLEILPVQLDPTQKIEPGKEATFNIKLKAPQSGYFNVTLQLFSGSKPFDQTPSEFVTQVKSPVSLLVRSSLAWKDNFAGEYMLSIASNVMNTAMSVILDEKGESQPVEARYLLPDYTFDFTLHKPFYKPKTIQAKVSSGLNKLDFGQLDPDFLSVLFKPKELWKLLPFSN